MTCGRMDIKELLPAYREGSLKEAEQARVYGHLETCADCGAELALLGMMAEESVPDPGEAFWLAVPAGVRRGIAEHQEQRGRFQQFMAGLLVHRWVWATAAAALMVVAAWFLVRPAPVQVARTAPPQKGFVIEEPQNGGFSAMHELSPAELEAAGQWAQNEFGRIRETIGEDAPDDADRDISDDLTRLSPNELDRLYEILKQKEQDVKQRLQKKAAPKKNIG